MCIRDSQKSRAYPLGSNNLINCSLVAGSTPNNSKFVLTCATLLIPTSAVVNPGTDLANCNASVEPSGSPSAVPRCV